MSAIPTTAVFAKDVDKANQDRFAALFDEHGDRVFRLCLRLCGGNHSEAEDLAQDALVAAFRALPRFAGRSHIATWLHAVTINTWRKRRSSSEPSTIQIPDGDQEIDDVSRHESDGQILRLSIDTAISRLPSTLREAFVLVKSESYTHKEAAKLLGVPQGTVQARVHEASRRLRTQLSDGASSPTIEKKVRVDT